MQSEEDPRTVLQAHKLRTELSATALIHGSSPAKGKSFGLRTVILSVIIAALILGGIIVVGYVIDLINNGFGARRR